MPSVAYMLWLTTLAILISGAGCGYRLDGGGFIEHDVTQVSVALFKNNSTESRAGISFTNELIREITARTDTLVVGAGHAASKISGTLQSITFATLARSSSENVTAREVTAVVDAVLTGARGEVRWSVTHLSATESYQITNVSVEDEANKQKAIDLIAKRVAERLVSQMTNDF